MGRRRNLVVNSGEAAGDSPGVSRCPTSIRPMPSKFFALIDGEPLGPLGGTELRRLASEGRLRPTDQIRDADGGEWLPATTLKGLEFGPKAPPRAKRQDADESREKTYYDLH